MTRHANFRQTVVGVVAIALLGAAATVVQTGEKKQDDQKKQDAEKQRPKGTAPDLELVNTVDGIELEGTGSPPVHYLIKAKGAVLRMGYKSPVLVLKNPTPDAQGNLTYYFAAEPPVGGTPGSPVPIEARRYLFDLQKVKSITVTSATNEIFRNLP